MDTIAQEYAESRNLTVGEFRFGHGVHGTVVEVIGKSGFGRSAIKTIRLQDAYVRERDAYLRLRDLGIFEMCGHAVPQLLDYDDHLQVIQMTIVAPPFVLDFGGAWLDHPPDFGPEVLAEWREQKREEFGNDWPHTVAILSRFRSIGIHISDVNANNIKFRNQVEDSDDGT